MTDKEILEKAEEIKKANKKRGLTDKVFIAVAILVVAAFIYSATLMWVTQNTDKLDTFMLCFSGFGTVVLTAIINKNTKENINKHSIVEREEEDNR